MSSDDESPHYVVKFLDFLEGEHQNQKEIDFLRDDSENSPVGGTKISSNQGTKSFETEKQPSLQSLNSLSWKSNFEAKNQFYILAQKIQTKILSLTQKLNDEKNTLDRENPVLECDSYLALSLSFEIFFVNLINQLGLFVLFALNLLAIALELIIIVPLLLISLFTYRDRIFEFIRKNFWEVNYKNLCVFLTESISQGFLLLIYFCVITPCIGVFLAQLICLSQIWEDVVNTSSTDESQSITIMKIFLAVCFCFISMKEVSSSWDNIAYFYKVSKEEFLEGLLRNPKTLKQYFHKSLKFLLHCMYFLFRNIPQVVQMFLAFYITFVNLVLIDKTSSPVDLIQNFAALAILLELDNIVIAFMRYLRFFEIYDLLNNCFDRGQKQNQMKENIKREISEKKRKLFESYIIKFNDILNDSKTLGNKKKIIERTKNLHENLKNCSIKYKKEYRTIHEDEQEFKKKPDEKSIDLFLWKISRFNRTYINEKLKNQKEALVRILTEKEYKIPQKFVLEDKHLFNFVGFVIIVLGMGTILYIFFEN